MRLSRPTLPRLVSRIGKPLLAVLLATGCLLLVAVPSPAAAQAGEPPLDYCFTPPSGPGDCYPSEAQALVAMRASTLVGEYLVRAEESRTNNTEWRWVVYRAEQKVAPESIGSPGFIVGGWTSDNLGCAVSSGNGPGHPHCQSEAEAVSIWVSNRAAFLSRSNCTYLRNSIVGAHAVPSGLSGAYSASRYGAAVFAHGPSHGGRYIDEAWWCPGWGTPDPVDHPTQISKTTPFACPAGFVIVNPAEDWPIVCAPRDNMRQMTVRVRQAESCKANDNPCYPATGEKQRHETDFEFAGEPFTRTYRSTGLLEQGNIGSRWHHSHGSRIGGTNDNYPHVINNDGSFLPMEWVSQSGGVTTYVARGLSDRIVKRVGATYEMVDEAGHTRIYDATTGRLLSRRHAEDPTRDLAYAYDGNGYLSELTDGVGRKLSFHYSVIEMSRPVGGSNVVVASKRVLTEVVLPDGKVHEYSYDASGNLAAVVRPDGSARQYHYDESAHVGAPSAGLMTGISDNGQRYATFIYDAYGRVTSSALAGGAERTELTYISRDIVDVTTANGLVRRYTYQPGVQRRLLSVADSFGSIQNIYGSDGRRTESVDRAGRRTRYAYTGGKVSQVTEAPGTDLERVTVINRDTFGRVTGSLVSGKVGGAMVPLSRSARSLDAQGRVLASCAVDPSGPGTSYACGSAADAPAGVRQTAFNYCSEADVSADPAACPLVGLLRSVDGPLAGMADRVQYVYRNASDITSCGINTGNCHRKGDLWKVFDASGRETEIVRHDLAGRIVRIRDMNQVITILDHDALGRLSSQTVLGTDPNSSLDDMRSTLAYDANGLVQQITQPDGVLVRFGYDAARRLTLIEDSLGNTINYSLDGAGNRFAEQTRDAEGVLARSLSRLFDDLGRVVTLADANANATQLDYDAAGQVDMVTDALGRTTDNAYDALGRLRESIANVAGTGSERAQTRFDYDALDRLTTVIDPKGLVTSYGYDGLGNLTQLVSPDTGTATYTYDEAGNRISAVDARGVLTLYAYDGQSRLTGIDRPSAGQDTGFVYDAVPAACAAGETFGIGRLGTLTDPSGSTQFCYDRRGNLVRKVQAVTGAAASRTVRYSHNLADRLVTMTYPSGATVTYTRDANGRITGISGKPTAAAATVSLVSDVTYLPFGPANVITFGNGRRLTKAYDLNYGIDAVTDSAAAGLSLDLGLDDVGNVTALDERLATGATAARTVTYDGQDRLTALKNGTANVQSFTYDATGNRTKKGSAVYTYAADSHHLTKIGSTLRSLDAAGNTTAIGTKTYTYDDAGRMSQYLLNGVVNRTFAINGLGQRVAKKVPGKATSDTYFVYDEAGHLIGEYRGNGTRIREIVWLDETPVAVLSSHAGSTYQYVLTDHLNTPRAVVHPGTNAIVWRWDLTGSAFGDHAAQNNPDGDANKYTFNLRYPGQYLDTETGLHYNYFRDYEPGTGRYVQSDPIGLGGGITTFGYVSGSPFGRSDPYGLFDVIARYNGQQFQYQFSFQSSMAEVMATRSTSAARSRAARVAGGLATLLASSQSSQEALLAASPAGMSDLALDPLAQFFGETLLEQCAAADGGFEGYYESKYPQGAWLAEDQALALLEQFRIQQNEALMEACRGAPMSCRKPFHDVMDFYGLRDPLNGRPIPRVLERARARMDTTSNLVLGAGLPGG
ncbi:RHS repeat-associated core domain-containing protein [Arenimonas alkanexedens]